MTSEHNTVVRGVEVNIDIWHITKQCLFIFARFDWFVYLGISFAMYSVFRQNKDGFLISIFTEIHKQSYSVHNTKKATQFDVKVLSGNSAIFI